MPTPYFIGIALPANLSEHIEKAQHKLKLPDDIIIPEQLHITLLHPHMLFATPPDESLPLARTIADKYMPLEIMLTTINCFDRRVLYIAAQSPNFGELYQKLLSTLPPDTQKKYATTRPYRPHVTIAKAKPRHKLPAHLITQLQKEISSSLPAKFTATHLTYFQWLRPQVYKLHSI